MADIHQDIEAQIPRLRRYARSLIRDVVAADDLVQQCLVRALAKLHLWQEGSDLRAWLFTILHNQYVNQIRRQIRSGTTIELHEAAGLPSRAPDQDKRLELRDLDRALGQLPEAQRTAILLIGLEGMSYGEAGVLLGIPVGTVRSRLSRGRVALRRLMNGELDNGELDRPARQAALELRELYRETRSVRSPYRLGDSRVASHRGPGSDQRIRLADCRPHRAQDWSISDEKKENQGA